MRPIIRAGVGGWGPTESLCSATQYPLHKILIVLFSHGCNARCLVVVAILLCLVLRLWLCRRCPLLHTLVTITIAVFVLLGGGSCVGLAAEGCLHRRQRVERRRGFAFLLPRLPSVRLRLATLCRPAALLRFFLPAALLCLRRRHHQQAIQPLLQVNLVQQLSRLADGVHAEVAVATAAGDAAPCLVHRNVAH